MGMIKSIWNFLKGGAKKLEDKINEANAEGNAKIEIDNAKKFMRVTTDKLTNFMAECAMKEREIKKLDARINQYNDIALKADKAGDQVAVDKAFDIVEKAELRRNILQEDVSAYKKQIREMKEKLEETDVKVKQAERDLNLYMARVDMAKTKKKMMKSSSSSDKTFDFNLDSLEKLAQKLESQVSASETLSSMKEEDVLEKYKDNSGEDKQKSRKQRLENLKK